jgi:hypothetical protein
MQNSSLGGKLLQAAGLLMIALLKLVALIIGCCCKVIGILFTWLSEIIFKIAEK